ncbi:hypothetical protein D3C73_1469950 [compost metagenome]
MIAQGQPVIGHIFLELGNGLIFLILHEGAFIEIVPHKVLRSELQQQKDACRDYEREQQR